MSSTSQQIDEAKKLAERVESGEQVYPISGTNTGGASAEQLTTQTPQQAGIDIPEDATVGGMNRENMAVVGDHEAMAVVEDREIAPVVGLDTELNLADQFKNPTVRAEEQTAIPDAQMTTAEKQTQLTSEQIDAADKFAKYESGSTTKSADETTAAKQTKVPEEQENSEVAKAQKSGSSGAVADADKDEHKDEHVEEKTETVVLEGEGDNTAVKTVKTEERKE